MISNRVPPHQIPKGMYDSGEGFYDPIKRVIYTYEMKFFKSAGILTSKKKKPHDLLRRKNTRCKIVCSIADQDS